ncbi:MAG: outer membrane lipoprotein carrier protein LolA [Candidatus Cryptobacteroides sp.]
MKKILTLIALAFLLGYNADAQQVLQDFSKAVSSHCANVNYSYKAASGTMITGSGTLKLQGDSFFMNGDGLEIWCDGKARWTLDRAAGEMVIEAVDDFEAGMAAADPAIILSSLDTHFKVKSSVQESGMEKVSLDPVSGTLGIADLIIWFRREAGLPVLSKARVTMDDGTMLELAFKSMSWSDKVPESDFSFDMSKAQKSWIVTDLR